MQRKVYVVLLQNYLVVAVPAVKYLHSHLYGTIFMQKHVNCSWILFTSAHTFLKGSVCRYIKCYLNIKNLARHTCR